jgi:hypothetical protein
VKFKIHLIEDWRNFHKFWSVRLSLIGSALLAAFFAYPEAMLHVWNAIPPDMKAYIPAKFAPFIPVSIIVAGVLARIIKQKGLSNDNRDESSRQRQGED